MFCSNCGAEVKGNFCSRCGTKAETESIKEENTPINSIQSPIPSRYSGEAILIRSENCSELLDDRKKTNDKGLNQLSLWTSLMGLLILFSPYLAALVEDKKLSQVDDVPLPVTVIILIVFILVMVLVFKAGKRAQAFYTKYKEYCATEVLVVDEKKIYGSTTKGSVTLYYNQIDSVHFALNTGAAEGETPLLPTDIFTVKDVAGNKFAFYSFINCKDLKAVIDTQLRRIRDGEV